MEKELLETLELIKVINEKLGSKVINKNEFAEEKENIHKFSIEKENLQKLLQNISKIDLNNKNICRENLLELYLIYIKLCWYIEDVYMLIRKLIANFNTCFPED